MIKGITVVLHEQIQSGTNPFGEPIYRDTPIEVDNVLVAPTSQSEILDAVNLYGKKAVYTIAIPKGDTHDWMDKRVTFFGRDFHVFGFPAQGIEDNIPLDWNAKYTVELYG